MYPLVNIHPEAKIAQNVVVEPFSTICRNVEIGEGTWIGPNVTIMEGARIGKNCKIFPGAVISAIPQDLKYKGEETTTHIGDNTTIRECVTINKGTVDRMRTVVGNNCLIMAYSHIAHDCIVGGQLYFLQWHHLSRTCNCGRLCCNGWNDSRLSVLLYWELCFCYRGFLSRKRCASLCQGRS